MAEIKKKPAAKKTAGTSSFKETGVKVNPKAQPAKKPATKKPAAKKVSTKEKTTKVAKPATEVATPVVEVNTETKQSLWQKLKNLFL